ncbi:TetR/AcrR family transcriptional regulator [Kineosporia sp. NBRC 101731]|uniref:TetR/AcrR family transcriptional regulator n=1 Tax=Kineosporia sp. NBRC 101731 TaxID=3032199 RepID=UPI0024A45035|nr:TetR/AcrR family transcriptional regulator [Kineosporia sp. NBRC 101731]GLY28665.1 TetR family transcriptional regulator [Kineosporia sp. NBRC 101731]
MSPKRADQGTRVALLDSAEKIFANKGYAGVGINELLGSVGVPKGSFYHYFSSKDAFGEAVVEYYFEHYLREMDQLLGDTRRPWADRLMAYWDNWRDTQSLDECQGRCLAVKLGAEVADMSEPMRLALKSGTSQVIDRVEKAIAGGIEDGSLTVRGEARATAESLYELWLGASVMAKVNRHLQPMDNAVLVTRQLLGI